MTAAVAVWSHGLGGLLLLDDGGRVGLVWVVCHGLDQEEVSLCTGPYEDYSLHWKQAVQYIPEVRCQQGSSLPLVVFHNT
jgi:hypothetical protein